jgi:hypothetical protein
MAAAGSGLDPTAKLDTALTEPKGAEALVSAAPYEFRALAEAVAAPLGAPMPAPPVELAVAEAEPVVLEADALELAAPPLAR